MKKTFLFFFTITLLYSCKKDYTCSCSLTYSNGQKSSSQERILLGVRKSDATKICIDFSETKNGLTTTGDCQLK